MFDINFLSGEDKGKNNKDKPEKEEVNLEWKVPEKEIKNKGNAQEGKDKHEINKESGYFGKNSIKESRKEVLSEIKKENGLNGKKTSAEYFSSWTKGVKEKIAGLFKGNKKIDKKGVMIDYQEVFNKEKEKRGNGKKSESADLFKKEKIYFEEKENGMEEAGGIKDVEHRNEPEVSIRKPKKIFGEKFAFSAPKWESLKVIKTNLIQGEESAFFEWNKKIMALVINVASACLFVAILYGGLILWEKQVNEQGEIILSDIEDTKKNIADMEKNISEVDNFQRNLNKVSAILGQHLYWTNFFEFLEKNTLAEVYYTGGFSGDTGGEYNLGAVAEGYSSIEGQLKVFRNAKEVISAESYKGSMGKNSEESKGNDQVSFDIDLKIRPNIFLK